MVPIKTTLPRISTNPRIDSLGRVQNQTNIPQNGLLTTPLQNFIVDGNRHLVYFLLAELLELLDAPLLTRFDVMLVGGVRWGADAGGDGH